MENWKRKSAIKDFDARGSGNAGQWESISSSVDGLWNDPNPADFLVSWFLGLLFFVICLCVCSLREYDIDTHSSFIYFLLFHVEDFWLNMVLLILFLWNLFEWIRNKRKSDRFSSIIYWFFNVIMLYLILLLDKKVACFFLLKKLHWASCSRRESNTLWY